MKRKEFKWFSCYFDDWDNIEIALHDGKVSEVLNLISAVNNYRKSLTKTKTMYDDLELGTDDPHINKSFSNIIDSVNDSFSTYIDNTIARKAGEENKAWANAHPNITQADKDKHLKEIKDRMWKELSVNPAGTHPAPQQLPAPDEIPQQLLDEPYSKEKTISFCASRNVSFDDVEKLRIIMNALMWDWKQWEVEEEIEHNIETGKLRTLDVKTI